MVSLTLLNNPAYHAYQAGQQPPLGLDAFVLDRQGRPIVEVGEVFCREAVGNGICGRKLKIRGNLRTHILRHGYHEIAPCENAVGRINADILPNIIIFYQDIMEEHQRQLDDQAQRAQQAQQLHAAIAAGVPPVRPFLLPGGALDTVRMGAYSRATGRVVPCANCIHFHGAAIVECEFDHEVDAFGDRVVGGRHCMNADQWEV